MGIVVLPQQQSPWSQLANSLGSIGSGYVEQSNRNRTYQLAQDENQRRQQDQDQQQEQFKMTQAAKALGEGLKSTDPNVRQMYWNQANSFHPSTAAAIPLQVYQTARGPEDFSQEQDMASIARNTGNTNLMGEVVNRTMTKMGKNPWGEAGPDDNQSVNQPQANFMQAFPGLLQQQGQAGLPTNAPMQPAPGPSLANSLSRYGESMDPYNFERSEGGQYARQLDEQAAQKQDIAAQKAEAYALGQNSQAAKRDLETQMLQMKLQNYGDTLAQEKQRRDLQLQEYQLKIKKLQTDLTPDINKPLSAQQYGTNLRTWGSLQRGDTGPAGRAVLDGMGQEKVALPYYTQKDAAGNTVTDANGKPAMVFITPQIQSKNWLGQNVMVENPLWPKTPDGKPFVEYNVKDKTYLVSPDYKPILANAQRWEAVMPLVQAAYLDRTNEKILSLADFLKAGLTYEDAPDAIKYSGKQLVEYLKKQADKKIGQQIIPPTSETPTVPESSAPKHHAKSMAEAEQLEAQGISANDIILDF